MKVSSLLKILTHDFCVKEEETGSGSSTIRSVHLYLQIILKFLQSSTDDSNSRSQTRLDIKMSKEKRLKECYE